ncbi:carboxylate-amine ligase [Pseudomonas aeruginosa]|uniref:Putative glutamate--cysteine ligase 2 n=2 Tax=Pseudomonas aeruginosa group TaxID=136841 RepID=GCS2_PSEP7|nr:MULTISPECIES: carboxylate-amine ligase [Pseudomonas aeruginosa group]A6V5Z4.1 RecName: Full=Putative glutamate--cysteine ligase 2; AltName: Full=Gamma-glutamylcysteine synthetase 2; Short=GCS 2; Short=Gamma-GCS 2 [Pseudomonas aeruginosa PA7]ABR85739.1 carboxylate-amine ligase [Pseudomonas aeruginosa PA7]KSC37493.1 carboxylate-amine ligase [Pseudomonas paraeruginosa]KSC93323.1 carboxylate-amine ligase [Pseudomonas aeruginosa]KSD28034.1 carboxylate-amine ligase [Pseudomonas aeruginosa]KSG429
MIDSRADHGLRFGIEEEFFLLDATDLDIARTAPSGFLEACRAALGEHFAEEMFECQVEVASPVFADLAQAARFHGRARQRLAQLAAGFGLRALCVGTHPFADWRRARSNPAAHFARLFEDQGRVARRSLVCGLHVHVEIPASHDRMVVLQQVLPWLPLLLALSASSPFRGGRRSGLASYRRALCGEWPRMNIPPALPDEDAYRRHLALLRESGCIREDGQVWWMVRPSSHVPTLELRICDACPRLADALCLAGLFRALVGQALLAGDAPAGPAARDACLEENYWQAMRHGCAGRYLVDGRCVNARDWLERAWRQCHPQARQGNEWAYGHAQRLLEENSADRQLQRYQALRAEGRGRQAALRRLVEELLEENLQALPAI